MHGIALQMGPEADHFVKSGNSPERPAPPHSGHCTQGTPRQAASDHSDRFSGVPDVTTLFSEEVLLLLLVWGFGFYYYALLKGGHDVSDKRNRVNRS